MTDLPNEIWVDLDTWWSTPRENTKKYVPYDAAPGPAVTDAYAAGMRRAADECKRLAASYTRSLAHYAEDDPQWAKIKWGAAAVTVAAENILAAIPPTGAWEPPAAWADVVAERRRQVEVEGWHPARDDAYTSGELARAGAAYAAASTYYHADPFAAVLSIWPWDRKWLKPTNPRRDLVKAAALLLAEIERIDRIPPAPAGEDRHE